MIHEINQLFKGQKSYSASRSHASRLLRVWKRVSVLEFSGEVRGPLSGQVGVMSDEWTLSMSSPISCATPGLECRVE